MTPCFFCGGPWHEASGSFYNERVRACGPCVRRFYGWFKGFIARWKKFEFYGNARTLDKLGPFKAHEPKNSC
jgi:hypothetical protein